MQNFIQPVIDQLTPIVGGYVLNLLGAIVILVVGWLVALGAGAAVRGILKRTSLDNRMAQWLAGDAAESVPVERIAGKAVFYLVMTFVLVAFFQTLQLTAITEPLNALLETITGYVPRVLAAGVLLLVAVVVASMLRRALAAVAGAAAIDRRFGDEVADGGLPLTKTLSDSVYWLVLMLFLPAVLGALAIEGLLAPVQDLMQRVLGFLPNLLGAGFILFFGWYLARLVQRVVSNLLASVGADRLSDDVGLGRVLSTTRLSALVGLVAYALILIPVIVAALDALALAAVTDPAVEMLTRMLAALPSLFAAALLMTAAYIAARVVAGLLTRVLSAIGFDNVLTHLGVATRVEAARAPSAVAGKLVVVGILVLASIEAAALLGFDNLSVLVADFAVFGAQILLGLVILGVGLYLSRLAADAIRGSGTVQAGLLAVAARGAIVTLAGTMALRQMNVASEIIIIAFGVLLGSVGIAAAVAFGLGSRDAAGRLVDGWAESLRGGTPDP